MSFDFENFAAAAVVRKLVSSQTVVKMLVSNQTSE